MTPIAERPPENTGTPATDGSRPPVTRRALLRRAGLGAAAVLVVGTGAIGYRAYDNGVFSAGTGMAYDPWRSWQDHRGTPLGMVAAAILAANAHNAQAWIFRVSDLRIDLYADRSRGTGALDPFRREMLVSLGCAIENCVIAGEEGGLQSTVTLRPDDARPLHVARLDLRRAAAATPGLYAQIPERHSSRDAFEVGRAVPAGALRSMAALGEGDLDEVRVVWFADDAGRRRVGDLMAAATEAVVADRDQARENDVWFRQDWDEVQRLRDGLTIDASGLSDLVAALAKVLPAQSDASLDAAWVTGMRERQIGTAAAFGIVTVPDAGDDIQRLRGGRALQRIHLWATREGIALQHMNQLTERADRERELGIAPRFTDALRTLVPAGREALVAFRVGYAKDAPVASPRRALESVVPA